MAVSREKDNNVMLDFEPTGLVLPHELCAHRVSQGALERRRGPLVNAELVPDPAEHAAAACVSRKRSGC